ncbi:MAG: baseplate J/gp47 family protein [Candidatus Marinimicrobia bacterium]|nr:baseplate J/gp47 family protein [Candidatus Neomarinimicrobiota bacterium]
MSYVQINNLDFNEIRVSLIEYLRAQSDFTDYDFEGSTLSVLIDLLAYNTYYTAFNTNMVVNELFLSSATLRDNVVSLAKQLGYKPKSITAPVAYVNFDIVFTGTAPTVIFLKKGTGFTTIFDDNLYQYVVVEDQESAVVNGTANFRTVPIYEGSVVTNSYTVNNALKSQRFIIDNPGADISSIRVKVFESQNSSSFQFYEYSDNILNVNKDSTVYYVEEIEDEKYELFFGDGVLGRKLDNGEFIEVSYLVTNGSLTNGARTFTFAGVLEDVNGSSNYPVNVTVLNTNTTPASGGEEIESISQIKYNAPKYFGTQDRAVTAQDYASIIQNIYPSIADVITYGGEEARNPEYGKVKVVIKPKNSAFLSSITKQEIIRKLKSYMVGSVTVDIEDPSIVYVEMNSKIYYSRSKTTQRPEEIRSRVISGLNQYILQSDTEKFNGKFRYSKFISVIDDSDKAINSNQTSIIMRKDFYPSLNSTFFYEICYQNQFDLDCEGPSIMSTGFTVSEYPNDTVYFEDMDGKIVLYRLDSISGNKITLNDSQGIVNYEKGEVLLYDLTIIKGSFDDNRIEVRAKPLLNDINALRNVYLDVDIARSKFTAYPE